MSELPLFFLSKTFTPGENVALPEDTARHIGQVLRMTAGEQIMLTDGNGSVAACTISDGGKKKISIRIGNVIYLPKPGPALHLAVAFTKNSSRNEWLLEKATELGVSSISPLITERSVRDKVRQERWNTILISAMLQSQQYWLPRLEAPVKLQSLLELPSPKRLVAHCIDDASRMPISTALKSGVDVQILIGPEGDFTPAEVSLATASGAVAISLGSNRLRTETAALAVLTHFYLINHAS